MKHKIILLLTLLFLCLGNMATHTQQGVVSAGGEAKVSDGTMSISNVQPDFSQVYSTENNASISNRQNQEISQKTKVDLICIRSDKNVEQDAAKKLHFFDQHIAVLRFAEIELNEYLKSKSKLQAGDIINLNLFEDVEYAAVINRLTANVNGTITFVAGVNDPEAYVIVTTTGERSLVSIFIPSKNRYYKIISDSQTLAHYLIEMKANARDILVSSPPLIPREAEQDTGDHKRIRKQIEKDGLGPDDPANIDVMVVLTPAAKAWANENGGGMHNVIAHAMANAQLTHDNSLTLVDFSLVHSGLVSYIESGNSLIDLIRLTASPSFNPWGNYYDGYYIPGFINEVHVWRDQYGADLVALFALNEDFGGYAWVLNNKNGSPNYGFSITRVQQALGYTHVHEMGHNMGCHHHKDQNVSPGPTQWGNWPENIWSAGWRWTGDDDNYYCSVMTYSSGSYFPDGIAHARVPYFSNPLVTYQGVATGDSVDGDNARTIAAVKHVIAAYRPQVTNFYDLTLEIKPPGTGIAEGAGAYISGDQVFLSAMATEGYKFANWTDSYGLVISHEATFSYTMPANHITLNANFEIEGSLNNIVVSQRLDGSGLFDINYDLIGKDDEYFIFLYVSFDGYDSFQSVPYAHLVGDLYSVSPGSNKHIIWDGAANIPNTFSNNAKIKIEAVAYSGTGIPGAGVTDIDGNFYNSVIIGNQEWITENLRVTKYNNGDAIPTGLSIPDWQTTTEGAYAIYNNINAMLQAYGKLYNWHAVDDSRGLCPEGWSVPSDDDWTALIDYVDNQGYPNEWDNINGAGNALKSCRQVGHPDGGDCDTSEHPRWNSHNTHYGFDEFGFSALPGGLRSTDGGYNLIGSSGLWWSSSEHSSTNAWYRAIYNTSGNVHRHNYGKTYGFNLRCVRNLETYNLFLEINPGIAGVVKGAGNYQEAEVVEISAVAYAGWQFINWTGDTDHIDDPTSAITTVTMSADNIMLTANFQQEDSDIIFGDGVIDYDGNEYMTVIIGNQEWMAENLRVTRDANGNDITRYCYDNTPANCELYGGLYTWHTVMNGESSSSSNPSGVQGICPTGWHVPSDAQWTELVNYMDSQGFPNSDVTGGAGNALKSCRQVDSPLGGACVTTEHPRWNSDMTHYGFNEFGFSALPGSARLTNGSYFSLGLFGRWWSSTEDSSTNAWWRWTSSYQGHLSRSGVNKLLGGSLRCVRDFTGLRAGKELILNYSDYFVFDTRFYELELITDPINSGTVSGAGIYMENKMIPIEATAATGYSFINWTDANGVEVSPEDSLEYIMPPNDVSVTANFTVKLYDIHVTVAPEEGGTVSGTGTYEHFQEVSLQAIPATYYIFEHWTEDDTIIMDGNHPVGESYSFTAEEDRILVAHFEEMDQYTIQVMANPEEGGTVHGGGIFYEGSEVSVEAIPNLGYTFINWLENEQHVSSEAIYTFFVVSDRVLVAEFDQFFEITAEVHPEGTGEVEGTGIFAINTNQFLEALPNEGYHFNYWTENGTFVGDEAVLEIIITGDQHFIAHFSINIYTINAEPNDPAFGIVDGSGDYEHFEEVTLTAIPELGYHFVDWTENGEVVIDGDEPALATYTFMVDGPRDLVANFAINTYILTYYAGENGSLSGETQQLVEYGADGMPVEAIPDEGYHFTQWSDSLTDNPRTDENITEDLEVMAAFAINIYQIIAQPNSEDFGTVTGGGTYEHFEEVKLTATPNTGYHFVEWTENEEVVMDGDVPAGKVYTFIAGEARDLMANFAVNMYIITATASEGGNIDPEGDIVIDHGASQLFTITADEGYEILDVLVDGDSVGAVDQYGFTDIGDNHTIEAIFKLKTYIITAKAGEGGSIDPEGNVVVDHGSSQLFIVTPDEGYGITNVLVDGNSMGDVDQYEFVNVMDNHAITAEFEILDETGIINIVDKVSVYPNPFDNTVTISNAAGLTRLVIKNIFGQTIFEKTIDGSNELIINAESFTPGVYIFTLTGLDNSFWVLKMIKE